MAASADLRTCAKEALWGTTRGCTGGGKLGGPAATAAGCSGLLTLRQPQLSWHMTEAQGELAL